MVSTTNIPISASQKPGGQCGPFSSGGPDWMQITPKAGSLFHANSQLLFGINAKALPPGLLPQRAESSSTAARCIDAIASPTPVTMSFNVSGRIFSLESSGALFISMSKVDVSEKAVCTALVRLGSLSAIDAEFGARSNLFSTTRSIGNKLRAATRNTNCRAPAMSMALET
jgi:hypothetical protein